MAIRGCDVKRWVIRHGHAPSRAANAAEKAIETKVRQEGRREVRRQLADTFE